MSKIRGRHIFEKRPKQRINPQPPKKAESNKKFTNKPNSAHTHKQQERWLTKRDRPFSLTERNRRFLSSPVQLARRMPL